MFTAGEQKIFDPKKCPLNASFDAPTIVHIAPQNRGAFFLVRKIPKVPQPKFH
jgi:hypothetical protein